MIKRALKVCSSGLIEGCNRLVSWLKCADGNTTKSLVLSVSARKQLKDARVLEHQEGTEKY